MMKSWIKTLQNADVPALQAYVPELTALVARADAAVAALDKATEELRDFQEIGERKALVDQLNAEVERARAARVVSPRTTLRRTLASAEDTLLSSRDHHGLT